MKTKLKAAWRAVKAAARDIGARAGHTFWQAFVGALGATWVASGLDVSQVVDVASAKRFILAALIAVGGAIASAVKSTVQAIASDPADYVGVHEGA